MSKLIDILSDIKFRHALQRMCKPKYCKIYTLGHFALVVWCSVDHCGFSPDYYYVYLYSDVNTCFKSMNKLYVEGHSWETGKYLFNFGVKEYNTSTLPPRNLYSTFYKLINTIKKYEKER